MPPEPSTKPRKQPQQDRSRVTVEAILEATTHVLTEEGYDKVNTARAIDGVILFNPDCKVQNS